MPLQVPAAVLDKFAFIADPYRQRMHAMVHYLDAEIGTVLSAMKQRDLWSNSLVVIHSDSKLSQQLAHCCRSMCNRTAFIADTWTDHTDCLSLRLSLGLSLTLSDSPSLSAQMAVKSWVRAHVAGTTGHLEGVSSPPCGNCCRSHTHAHARAHRLQDLWLTVQANFRIGRAEFGWWHW